MKRAQNLFSATQFLSYMAFGLFMTNLIPFMESIGYNAYERGLSLSGIAVITILLQLLFGYLSDRFQKIKPIAMVSLTVFSLATACVFQAPKPLIILIGMVSIAGGLLNTLCGLQDNWVLGVRHNFKERLSRIKAFGSMGWAIGSLSSTVLLSYLNYQELSLVMISLAILALFCMIVCEDKEHQQSSDTPGLKDSLQLFANKNYLLLVLALFLLYGMVVANTSLVVDKMLLLKATTFEISLKWAMGSFLEIPMYLIGMRLIHSFGSVNLLKLSALVSSLQFILFGMAQSSFAIVLICILQVFTTPIIMLTSKLLINELVSQELQNSGQMLALSLFIGGASLLIPTVSGFLGITFGYSTALLIFSLLGGVALLVLSFLKESKF